MASPAQIEANRRNAQQSTGPKTDEGKARSSKNALSHGLFAEDMVLPDLGETEDDLLKLQDRLYTQYQPRTFEEEDLVEDILGLRWRLQRARRAETGRLNLSMHLQLLQSQDKWDAQAEAYLHPQPGESERAAQTRILGTTICAEAGEMAKLALYESRLQKMLERSQDRLKKLQAERRKAEAQSKPAEPPAEHQASNAGGGQPPRNWRNEPNFEPPQPKTNDIAAQPGTGKIPIEVR